jgi:erythromycin esterase-like protein
MKIRYKQTGLKRQNKLTNMNNVTLAHIGGDLVLIGGLAFYFHKKNNAMMKEITLLKQQNQQLNETIMELQENIQQLGNAFMQFQQMNGQMAFMDRQPKRNVVQPQTLSQQRRPLQKHNQRRIIEEKPKKNKKMLSDSDDSGDETYDDKDLDKELSKEYTTLAKERDTCKGEQCELIE